MYRAGRKKPKASKIYLIILSSYEIISMWCNNCIYKGLTALCVKKEVSDPSIQRKVQQVRT